MDHGRRNLVAKQAARIVDQHILQLLGGQPALHRGQFSASVHALQRTRLEVGLGGIDMGPVAAPQQGAGSDSSEQGDNVLLGVDVVRAAAVKRRDLDVEAAGLEQLYQVVQCVGAVVGWSDTSNVIGDNAKASQVLVGQDEMLELRPCRQWQLSRDGPPQALHWPHYYYYYSIRVYLQSVTM